MPIENTARADVAQFPCCAECGVTLLSPTPDGPICFRLCGGRVQTIPRSQNAQLLRFLWTMRPRKVVGDHLYLALDHCRQESRAIRTLRKRGIPIVCENVPKATKAGTYGLYSLGEGIEVWEPENVTAAGEA